MKELTDNEIIVALNKAWGLDEISIYCADDRGEYIASVEVISVVNLMNRLQSQKEALIAGQETLQKALAEKDKEIERLKAENELLQRNADEAFQEGLNENRSLFVKEVIQEIQQVICDNTYPDADSSGNAVMIWKARTGYDAVKEAVLKKVGDAE